MRIETNLSSFVISNYFLYFCKKILYIYIHGSKNISINDSFACN